MIRMIMITTKVGGGLTGLICALVAAFLTKHTSPAKLIPCFIITITIVIVIIAIMILIVSHHLQPVILLTLAMLAYVVATKAGWLVVRIIRILMVVMMHEEERTVLRIQRTFIL